MANRLRENVYPELFLRSMAKFNFIFYVRTSKNPWRGALRSRESCVALKYEKQLSRRLALNSGGLKWVVWWVVWVVWLALENG